MSNFLGKLDLIISQIDDIVENHNEEIPSWAITLINCFQEFAKELKEIRELSNRVSKLEEESITEKMELATMDDINIDK